jgi:hypothetical protein
MQFDKTGSAFSRGSWRAEIQRDSDSPYFGGVVAVPVFESIV